MKKKERVFSDRRNMYLAIVSIVAIVVIFLMVSQSIGIKKRVIPTEETPLEYPSPDELPEVLPVPPPEQPPQEPTPPILPPVQEPVPPQEFSCGDGICTEDPNSCPTDCGPPPEWLQCGDTYCNIAFGESVQNCPRDCYLVYGCMDPNAENYHPEATQEDGSCVYCNNDNVCNENEMNNGNCPDCRGCPLPPDCKKDEMLVPCEYNPESAAVPEPTPEPPPPEPSSAPPETPPPEIPPSEPPLPPPQTPPPEMPTAGVVAITGMQVTGHPQICQCMKCVPKTCNNVFGENNWIPCLDGIPPNCCAKDAKCNSILSPAVPPACCPKYTNPGYTRFFGGVHYCEKTDDYCKDIFGQDYSECGVDCCYTPKGAPHPGRIVEKCEKGWFVDKCVKDGKCDQPNEEQCDDFCCIVGKQSCVEIKGSKMCSQNPKDCSEGETWCPGRSGSKYELFNVCCPVITPVCWWHPDGTPYCVKSLK